MENADYNFLEPKVTFELHILSTQQSQTPEIFNELKRKVAKPFIFALKMTETINWLSKYIGIELYPKVGLAPIFC